VFRITTALGVGSEPNYDSAGAGVEQYDAGGSYADVTGSPITTGLKNLNEKGLKLGAYGIFGFDGTSWLLIAPTKCGDLV
jgi:hypothetical protein